MISSFSIAAVDLNGDGKPDLAMVDNGPAVAMLLGNGDGTFQAPVSYILGGQATAVALAVADVNGDGKPDLLVANLCATGGDCGSGGSAVVLLGNDDGTFQTAKSYGSGGVYASSLSVADVNGDGKPRFGAV